MPNYDPVADFWQWHRRRQGLGDSLLADHALDKCEETFRKSEWDRFRYWHRIYLIERRQHGAASPKCATRNVSQTSVMEGTPPIFRREWSKGSTMIRFVAVLFITLLVMTTSRTDAHFIMLGSATSVTDSGLLKHILPIFHAATGLNVRVEIVGSGRALAMGARGDVDALFVQDRPEMGQFVADGFGIDRREAAYNDFIIVGPNYDPAGVRGANSAVSAFRRIAGKGALFASRGDDGGTHAKELRLWKAAGINPLGKTWYVDLSEGVGATLSFAAALDAYTLTDRATWENFKARQSLEILAEGGSLLFDPYYSILINPEKCPGVKFDEARLWQNWLTSKAGINAITSYRIDDRQVFFAASRQADRQ
jgi:tungstate transport system substrate-binding protein